MRKFRFNLFLFDGEGTGVEGAAAAGQQDGRAAEAAGATESAADSQAAAETDAADLEGEFEGMITGKYKDQYDRRVQDIINRRLRGVKNLRDTVKAQQPIIDLLKERYGAEADLLKALEEDDANLSREAEELNLSKEQLLEKKRQVRQQRMAEQEERQRRNQEIIDGWNREAEAMREKYGNFDLEREFENQEFADLVIRGGIPIEMAHKVVHVDEYLQGAIAETAKQVKAATAETIRARGNRPVENGMGAAPAVSTVRNFNEMSVNEINDILRRAAQGEKVTF